MTFATVTTNVGTLVSVQLPDDPAQGPFLIKAAEHVTVVHAEGMRPVRLLPGEQAYFETRRYPPLIAMLLIAFGCRPYRWIVDRRS